MQLNVILQREATLLAGQFISFYYTEYEAFPTLLYKAVLVRAADSLPHCLSQGVVRATHLCHSHRSPLQFTSNI